MASSSGASRAAPPCSSRAAAGRRAPGAPPPAAPASAPGAAWSARSPSSETAPPPAARATHRPNPARQAAFASARTPPEPPPGRGKRRSDSGREVMPAGGDLPLPTGSQGGEHGQVKHGRPMGATPVGERENREEPDISAWATAGYLRLVLPPFDWLPAVARASLRDEARALLAGACGVEWRDGGACTGAPSPPDRLLRGSPSNRTHSARDGSPAGARGSAASRAPAAAWAALPGAAGWR